MDEKTGEKPYAQVRMAAVIDQMENVTPDPATGRIFGRIFAEPHVAATLLA